MNLTELANHYQSDKGNLCFEQHYYTQTYEQLFAPLKNEKLNILEIGLRHDAYYETLERSSPSLNMWLDYFPNAHIFGFDIIIDDGSHASYHQQLTF